MADSKKTTTEQKTYFSNGQALATPPLTVRISRLFDSAIQFGGLYLTTLFSFDAYAAAAASPLSNGSRETYRTGGSSSSRTSGAGSGGFGSSGNRVGTMDNLRRSDGRGMPAPVRVCGSC